MNDTVLVAIIGGLALVVSALIQAHQGRRLKRVEDDTKATREQVENNHPTNLREESDERHHENAERLEKIAEILEAVQSSLRRVWARLEAHDEQLEEIDELTHPHDRSRFAPHPRHLREGH